MSIEKEKTVHILIGLPASGKSHFTFNSDLGKIKSTKVLDLDRYFGKETQMMEHVGSQLSYLSQSRAYYSPYITALILDGLFLSMSDVRRVLDLMKEVNNRNIRNQIDNVVLHYWEEDREACLFNDRGRREKSSTQLITKGELMPKPDIKQLNSDYEYTITVESHFVTRKDEIELFKDTYCLNKNSEYLKSCQWSTGGAHGNCWDDSMSYSSGDEPLEFEELDVLLESICPDISFLTYKKIKALANIEEYTDSEYYGGYTNYQYWKISIKALYAKLEELGILEEHE